MTDKSKPWFRLKLRDDIPSETHARIFSKEDLDNMRTDWLPSELVVYGASPMIMAFSDDKVEYKAINPVEFFEGVVKITDNSVTKQINLSTKQVAERFL